MADPAGAFDQSTGDFEEVPPHSARPRVRLEIAAVSHPGLCRDNNEDNFLAARMSDTMEIETTSLASFGGIRGTEDGGYLLVVADGMGGVEGGERASALAVESIESFFRDQSRSLLQLERTDETALLEELKASVARADCAVFEAATADSKLAGMGTTLTMAFGIAESFVFLHVGDSRAYLFQKNKLHQITTDHTFVQMLVNSKMISVEEARTHAKRNVVTNVLGGPELGIEVETHKLKLEQGDLLMLCSDGLTEPVDNATIEFLLQSEPNPTAATKALLAKALENGGPDNITILIAVAHIQT